MTADEVIEGIVLEMTAAKMEDFAERRLGQGVSNDQLNAEMKDLIPEINVWRRQATNATADILIQRTTNPDNPMIASATGILHSWPCRRRRGKDASI